MLCGQNGIGQNGSGQTGTDKMVWTKCYTDKMLIDKMVRTNGYGQKGTDKMLCWQNVTKQWSVHKKYGTNWKRLIHRKATLNKLKSIIFERNCDYYNWARLAIDILSKWTPLRIWTRAAGIEIISDDHYTTTAHTVICEKKLNLRREQDSGGLSVTAGVIAQVRFVELFFENSGVNDDQSGEFGNYFRLSGLKI